MFKISGKIKLFAFDLDGTLYLGDNIIPGAVKLIDYLREKYRVVFFTNNSSKTRREVGEKLNRLGIECELDELYVSSSITSLYLIESGIDNLYVIGSDSFRNELESNGLKIVNNDSAKNLVVGFDLNFNFQKIATALSILLNGGKFIVCNEDANFPIGENKYMPACGAMVGAIASSAKKKPNFIIGKPNTYILSKIEKAFGVDHHEIIVVGDSYDSDIMMALNNGSKAILINHRDNINNRNVLVLENLIKILQYIKED
ncbi:HAD-IIA family hydrolase [Desulfococcaceae bacterium HSG7]|nr:HAD-IIA family hydrolase [Desulfococcaceae bacterium HSG7]